MKVKVIGELEDKGREFKVRRMTYNDVTVNYPTGTGLNTYKYKDVELVSEGEIDDFLIGNMEFLKIKLNRGISVFFYKALKDSLKEEINEELEDFNLLRDRYNVNKRGIWGKEIIGVINGELPVRVVASGQNFKRNGYSIEVKPIQISEFLEASTKEIYKINEEIKRKQYLIESYEKALKTLNLTNVSQEFKVIK